MEKIEHTPGPWAAAKNDNAVICAGDDPVRPGKILFVLRHPWGTDDHLPLDELEANGRLCAAAPELLAALQLVRELIVEAAMTGFNCHDGDWAERLFASQQVSHDAIVKAGVSARTKHSLAVA